MMQLLSKIWQEIKKGENLDTYATIFIAIVLAILNALGLFPQSLAPFTLAILALLAFTALGDRHRLNQIIRHQVSPGKEFFLTKLADAQQTELEEKLSTCSEIIIFGTTLGRTLDEFYPLFKSRLEKNEKFKVSLVIGNPESHASEMAVMRKFDKEDLDTWRLKVKSTLLKFKDLQSISPDSVDVKVIDFHLAHGGIIVDPNSSTSLLFLWYYSFKTSGGTKPKFILRPTDDPWYKHFVEEAYSLLSNSQSWQL